jgi:hypothetical protein
MEMGMKQHLLIPTVEHCQKAEFCPEAPGIAGHGQ